MSHDELHRYFEAVLTASPQDRGDVDDVIDTAVRQQHRRRLTWLSAGLSCALVAGIVTVAAWPDRPGRAGPATGASPSTSPDPGKQNVVSTDSVEVTSPDQLFGAWTTVQLDDTAAPSTQGRTPLSLTFMPEPDGPVWVANDTCNHSSGTYTITDGTFSASSGYTTLVGCKPVPIRERNVAVLAEADRAVIEPERGPRPRSLLLMHKDRVIARYAYQPTGRIHGSLTFTGGPVTETGKAPPDAPAANEHLSLLSGKQAVRGASTDKHGTFDIQAPPGDYTLVIEMGCPAPVEVRISDQQTTPLALVCDRE